MVYLRSVKYIKDKHIDKERFPFNIPLIRAFEEVEFDSPVTIFVGENGTGKSTIVEALAASTGSVAAGGEFIENDETLKYARELGECFKLTWNVRTHRGFFLRAEDFFNYAKKMSRIRAEMEERLLELEDEYKDKSAYALSYARMPYCGSLYEMEKMYGEGLDCNSHGEGFLKLFQSRLVPGGLYILDEPEAALSPMRQLAFVSMVKEMVDKRCQFIIATHSPIIMAYPGAAILSFDSIPIKKVKYDELEHVNIMRDFLNNPEQFLRHL